jgi:hypothetical protein
MPDKINFEFDTMALFDRYVRALERNPRTGIREFAHTQEPPTTPGLVSERFTNLERNLGNVLLIPRRLIGQQDARGEPKIVMTWKDAHILVDGEVRRVQFDREPGLTPDGEAWAIFAAFAVSQYGITKKLLLQRRGGVAPYPFNVHGEIERIGFVRPLQERASAMRHVADLVDEGGISDGTELVALLDETASDRRTRLGRMAFRAFAMRENEPEQEVPDDRPDV